MAKNNKNRKQSGNQQDRAMESERGAETLARPTVTPDLALTAEPPPVPRDMPLTASTRDGTAMVRAAAGRGVLDSVEPL